ncbi:sugar phosphate isomerase/epimerase [Novosphingobium sp. G106]|uniref:sugar phosphate isomerase/epimerase family protein n=1 Tax=Novosphingobium sp. G106 TaxID=2849500 RepID=UPI001C2DBA7D|nr:TIM barrel protein [Novosphingobium sp. G106]MBV1690228.1 sugar phosphate isomerase/epimerase [Novosphingobium sp. G106]
MLGIERLGLFGMPPPQIVALAADLGCDCVGIGLAPAPGGYNPDDHPAWNLREDPAQRRETVAAARDLGVRIAIVEGFAVLPDNDMGGFAGDLDLVAELGCDRINVVSIGKDMNQAIDGFGVLSEIAAERGLQVSAEMGSLGPLDRVAPALEVTRGVGRPNFSLVIDSMHFFRLGNSLADFAALDPALIGYVQLADAPWAPRFDTYMEEAMYERMAPGDGELPLQEFVRLVPEDVVISLEIPIRSLAEAGIGPRERTRRCVEGARRLLAAR